MTCSRVRYRSQGALIFSLSCARALSPLVINACFFIVQHVFVSLSPLCFLSTLSVCLSSSVFLGQGLRPHGQWRCWLPGRLPQQAAQARAHGEVAVRSALCFTVRREPRGTVPLPWGEAQRWQGGSALPLCSVFSA